MSVLSEIETVVEKELGKLKVKLEAFANIKSLEAEIERWKEKLEGSTDPASAITTAQTNVAAAINNAKPTLDMPTAESPTVAQ